MVTHANHHFLPTELAESETLDRKLVDVQIKEQEFAVYFLDAFS
jgi:hypothetical protein